eukprot:8222278-Pyramimonas_sp.AAC.1
MPIKEQSSPIAKVLAHAAAVADCLAPSRHCRMRGGAMPFGAPSTLVIGLALRHQSSRHRR